MKIAIVGNDLRAAALANALAREGCQVTIVPGSPELMPLRRGVRLHPLPPEEGPAWWQMRRRDDLVAAVRRIAPDLVIALHVESSDAEVVDALRAMGRRHGLSWGVVGVDRHGSTLETSKCEGLHIARAAGLSTPSTKVLTVADRSKVTNNPETVAFPCVVKADGLAGGRGTVIAKSQTEYLDALRSLPPGDLIVQEYVLGHEIALSLWIVGGKIDVLNLNFEYKRELDGDRGGNTPGMGTVATRAIPPEAARILLADLPSALAQMHYAGPLDLSFIVRPEGEPVFLEFTARFGDPELMSELLLLDEVTAMFEGAARGVAAVTPRIDATWTSGVVARGDASHVTLSDTADRSLLAMTSGKDWTVCASANGTDVRSTITRTYALLSGTEGLRFRRDIGHDALLRACAVSMLMRWEQMRPSDRGSLPRVV